MSPDHRLAREPLEVRGARVVGVERLDDAGARDARDVAEEDDHERDRRQRQVLHLRQRPRAGLPLRGDRQPAEPDREDEDEHEPGDELGDDGEREPDDRDRRDRSACPTRRPARTPPRIPNGTTSTNANDGELQRVDERRLDDVPDRDARLRERLPEVALDAPPSQSTYWTTAGRSVPCSWLYAATASSRGVPPEHGASDVSGQELSRREHDHAQQDERDQREAEALGDVAGRSVSPCRGRPGTSPDRPLSAAATRATCGRCGRARSHRPGSSGPSRRAGGDIGDEVRRDHRRVTKQETRHLLRLACAAP